MLKIIEACIELPWWWNEPWHVERREILKLFCSNLAKIIDVGCGSYELLYLKRERALKNEGASVGVDISLVALKNNKKEGFKGDLVRADCRFLPFRDKCFDAAIFSEVIEHLDSITSVKKAILELKRIANSVIITTPNCAFGFKWKDPGHKIFFTSKKIRKVLEELNVDFTLFTSNIPPDKIVYNYLPYESSKLKKFLIGKIIASMLKRIDQSLLARYIARKLWKGAYLILVIKS